jgi:peptidoglycan/xylan/chitin deacetylase (PgdA/CDA1 family)
MDGGSVYGGLDFLCDIRNRRRKPAMNSFAATPPLNRETRRVSALSIMVLGAAFLFASCTVRQEVPGLGGRVVARSDEYALYAPGEGETLSDVAGIFYGDGTRAWLLEDANPDGWKGPGAPLVVPLTEGRLGGLFETGYQGVPILCYHQFGTGSASPMVMPPDLFEEQMRYLKRNGYRMISPETLEGFLSFRSRIPRKSVILTIDDGYRSFLEVAYPVLKRFGFTATLFVYTDYIGMSPKALSWDDLRFLKAEGFTIGSHSVSHSDLTRAREGESPEQTLRRIRTEVYLSKAILDRELGQDTRCFSYPFGRSDQRVEAMVRQAGYTMAFSVDRGNNPFFSNPLDLNRDMIVKRDMASFVSRLGTFNPVSLR